MPPKPVLQRVHEHLLQDDHTLNAGSLAKTTRMLASDLGLPNGAVMQALDELLEAGLLEWDEAEASYVVHAGVPSPAPPQMPAAPAKERRPRRKRATPPITNPDVLVKKTQPRRDGGGRQGGASNRR